MAEVYNPQIARVVINMLNDGQKVQNTLHFRLNGSPSIQFSDLVALGNAVLQWCQSDLFSVLPNAVSLMNIQVRSMAGPIAPQYLVTPVVSVVGGIAEAPAPNSVSLAIAFNSGLTGRAARGRNYFPGFAVTQIDGNTVKTAVINAIKVVYEALNTDLDLEDWEFVVVSKMLGGVARELLEAYSVASVGVTDPTVDNQRRRLPGRGR